MPFYPGLLRLLRAPASRIILSFTLLVLIWAGSLHPLQSAEVRLENKLVAVLINPRQGTLSALIDKQTGRSVLIAQAKQPMYEIMLQDNALTLTAKTASSTSVTRERTKNGQALIIIFHHTGKRIMDVECRFALPDDTAEVLCRLNMRSPAPFIPEAIHFPIGQVPLRLGTQAVDDYLLLPHMDGLLIERPERNMQQGSQFYCDYPGTASLQLIAHYDKTAGLYMSSYDALGTRKQLGFARVKDALTKRIISQPALKPVTNYQLPYPVGLGVFHGDWQAPALIYRRWAERQPWCRTPLSERTDIPKWLLRAPFFYTMSMRAFPQPAATSYATWLPRHIAEFGKSFDTNVQVMLMGWEKHGSWIAPDYFPPYGGIASFRLMTSSLQAEGHRTMLFHSGVKWTLQKEYSAASKREPYNTQELFQREQRKLAIMDRTQKPLLGGQPNAGMGQYAWRCPAVAQTQTEMMDTIRVSQLLGVNTVQLDQLPGGGIPICYAPNHGHPPGGGDWAYHAVKDLLLAMRNAGKQHDPDFCLTLESLCELFIPYVDAYHAREYVVNRWPREGQGQSTVPLFTFVYHAYALGYGGDSVTISAGYSRQSVLAIATNLVQGKIPAVAVWERYLPAPAIHPAQASMLRAALWMIHSPAHEYLLFGNRLVSASAGPRVMITSRNPETNNLREMNFPAVPYSVWTLPDHRIGVVLANITDAPITLPLTLSVLKAPAPAYRISRQTVDDPTPTILAEGAWPDQVTVTVPANSALLLDALPLALKGTAQSHIEEAVR